MFRTVKNLDCFFFRFVTIHTFDRQTDGQTDRQKTERILIARPRLHSMQRGKTKSWSGHSSSLEKLLWSKMELMCWIVIYRRWRRKLGSWLSPEIDAILRPSSEKKAIDDSFNGPSVSETSDLSVLKGRIWLSSDQPPVQLLHHLSEPSRSHKSPLACAPLWHPKSRACRAATELASSRRVACHLALPTRQAP